MCELFSNIIGVLVIAQFMLSLGVGIWLFATSGPRKSFDQELRDMHEDGLKTYRR